MDESMSGWMAHFKSSGKTLKTLTFSLVSARHNACTFLASGKYGGTEITPSSVPGYIAGKTTIQIIVESGILLFGTVDGAHEGLYIHGFDVDDVLLLQNAGIIIGGAGSEGGGGYSASPPAGAGQAGYAGFTGLKLDHDITIINNGAIYGGAGGGGGGGQGGGATLITNGGAGGDGGTGQALDPWAYPWVGVAGVARVDYAYGYAGAGGTGGNGGAIASAGSAGSAGGTGHYNSPPTDYPGGAGGAGGAAGAAIDQGGFTATISVTGTITGAII